MAETQTSKEETTGDGKPSTECPTAEARRQARLARLALRLQREGGRRARVSPLRARHQRPL
jgi:hypothetical protein